MAKNSRRKFIQNLTITGAAALSMSSIDAFSVMVNNTSKRKATKGMVILFQGDSITDGNRGRNNDPNHIMGHGYAFSIASRLGADYPELDLNFYNRGISGNKIIDLADRWQTDTLNLKPVVLSILIGVNDASSVVMNQEPLVPVEKYEEVYRTLLTETHKTLPDCIVVLCGPFILKTGNVANHWDAYVYDVKQRQAVVRKLADEFAAVFVDFQDVFNEACIKAPAEYWIWDGVHPTVPGHELMAREWIKQIEKILSF